MIKDYNKYISKLLTLYSQEEVEALLGVTYKSIENYLKGENPGKRVRNTLDTVEKKLSESSGKGVPFSELLVNPRKVSATDVLVHVLLQEFAEYKAEKEGLDSAKVIKDIESKARLILNVSGKV